MMEEFSTGIAFIFEGDTEKEFYMVLLEHLCCKHCAKMERIQISSGTEVAYRLTTEDNSNFFIKMNLVNTITQIPRAGQWFSTQCAEKYKSLDWHVFLCYDQDSYKEDISKFYEGDWVELRRYLKKAKSVNDIAAAADIEDIMLQDITHICQYLNCSVPASLKGRKGKVKMKNLFRENGMVYHEGKRARPVIEALDMEFLLNESIAPLGSIESLIFK
ncbi:MAG: hypothetical protein LUI07_07025 [Lachnospiraceae bacterium]|nr:hypothetical protein [Lachnospiraceae bacterium]